MQVTVPVPSGFSATQHARPPGHSFGFKHGSAIFSQRSASNCPRSTQVAFNGAFVTQQTFGTSQISVPHITGASEPPSAPP